MIDHDDASNNPGRNAAEHPCSAALLDKIPVELLDQMVEVTSKFTRFQLRLAARDKHIHAARVELVPSLPITAAAKELAAKLSSYERGQSRKNHLKLGAPPREAGREVQLLFAIMRLNDGSSLSSRQICNVLRGDRGG